MRVEFRIIQIEAEASAFKPLWGEQVNARGRSLVRRRSPSPRCDEARAAAGTTARKPGRSAGSRPHAAGRAPRAAEAGVAVRRAPRHNADGGFDPGRPLRAQLLRRARRLGQHERARCSGDDARSSVAQARARCVRANRCPPTPTRPAGLRRARRRELIPLAPRQPDRVQARSSPPCAPAAARRCAARSREAYARARRAQRIAQLGYGEYHLVVVTDGEATGEDPTRRRRTDPDRESPVVLHTIGFCIGDEAFAEPAGPHDLSRRRQPASSSRRGLRTCWRRRRRSR